MLDLRIRLRDLSVLALLVLATLSPQLAAAPQTNPENVPVTTIVTVLGPKFSAPPALGKRDVIVRTGDHREDVTNWIPAQGEQGALQLAVLIDDGTDLGSYLDELRRFIQAQPKGTK